VAWRDEAAFTAFYGRTARGLWAYVYRTTGNAADADDIVQEAFCRVVTANVEPLDEEDRRRYLFRTASNLMVDRWRRATREQWGRESFVADTTSRVSATNDSRPHLDTAATFAGLKPRERALLWLAYVEEHDHRTIASALGVGKGSVKVLLSRARARLRDLLEARGMIGRSHG